MYRSSLCLPLAILISAAAAHGGGGSKQDYSVLGRPLSKVEALNLAIAHNGTILQAQQDVKAAAGVAIQVRAILFPKIVHTASYVVRQDSLIEANQDTTQEIRVPGLGSVSLENSNVNNQAWIADTQITQSIYEGGRMRSAARSAVLIRAAAVFNFDTVVANTLLSVSAAYDEALRTGKQVEVRNAEVTFLAEYVSQTEIKFNVGAIPEFDLIRAQVELANAQAQQTQALGDNRVAKQKFVELLGYNVPSSVSDNLKLNLTSPLVARRYGNELPAALAAALRNRTELAALDKEEQLAREGIIVAEAGLKPSVQAFAAYDVTSRAMTRSANEEVHGGLIGAQLSWPVFDGFF